MSKELYYFRELEDYLKRIPEQERSEILMYHVEYAEDGGLTTDKQLIEHFGKPKELASKIYADSAIRTLESDTPKKHTKAFGIGLLALFSLPITGPLFIALLVIIISLIITMFSVVISFASVALATGISAIAFIINGFYLLGDGDILGMIQFLGASALSIGVMFLFIWVTKITAKSTMYLITKGVSSIIRRRKNHG